MTKKEFLEYKLDRAKHFLREREFLLRGTYGTYRQSIKEVTDKLKKEIEELRQQLEKF